MSNVTDKMPASVRAYVEALSAWNLAAADWLGLNPDEVFDLDVDTGRADQILARWKSIEEQTPRFGADSTTAEFADETVTYTGVLSLGWHDSKAFMDAVGPKPEMFTAEERARLAALA